MNFLEKELRSMLGPIAPDRWNPFATAVFIGNVALTELSKGVLAKVSFAGLRELENRYTGIQLTIIGSAGFCDHQFFSFEEIMGRVQNGAYDNWLSAPYIEANRNTGEMVWKPDGLEQAQKDQIRDAVIRYVSCFLRCGS